MRGARDWYEARASGLGDRFLAAVGAEIEAILANPLSRQVIDGKTRRGVVRRFPYSVYYLHDAARDVVTVYAMLHHARDPEAWRARRP